MKKTLKSFLVAIRGIFFCINNESHMRFHLVSAVFVLIFMRFFNLTTAESSLVFIVIALVVMAEMINTALEVVIDKISPEYSTVAQNVKDIAAGAVLVMSIGAVCVALFIFTDINGFINAYNYFSSNIISLIALIILVVLSVLFLLFGLPKKIKN